MNKKARHNMILEIIETNRVSTQEELADLLQERGCQVTQATVSRDIRELRLTKVASADKGQRYVALSAGKEDMGDKFIRVLRDGFVSMDRAENILVIRTVSGMAMAVAAAIDAMHFDRVLGCIAGDDTIFVAVRTSRDTEALMDLISGMLSKA